jgi:TPR repeat protein
MSDWCRVTFLRENVFWYKIQRENEIMEDRHGLNRAREDQAKAELFEQFLKAAEAGDADAQNDAGICLIHGYGTPSDLDEGILG